MKEEWSLKIIRIDNGYFLEGSDGQRIAVEEDEIDELREHQQLLCRVQDYFNFQGSKHDKERIYIGRSKSDET